MRLRIIRPCLKRTRGQERTQVCVRKPSGGWGWGVGWEWGIHDKGFPTQLEECSLRSWSFDCFQYLSMINCHLSHVMHNEELQLQPLGKKEAFESSETLAGWRDTLGRAAIKQTTLPVSRAEPRLERRGWPSPCHHMLSNYDPLKPLPGFFPVHVRPATLMKWKVF